MIRVVFVGLFFLLIYPINTLETSMLTLTQAYEKKGSTYQPRTQHLNEDGLPKFINELILESSPYLLQHAHNPVNWYAWSEKTLKKAQKENKLIFLSIGYATCHWCHVMEEESFDNEQVAQVLNKDFISIKVDREVRPDIDEVFMSAVQLINGHGGWPLNIILTPEGHAFFGGTYFPKNQLISLLQQVQNLWQTSPKRVLKQADDIESELGKIKQETQNIAQLNQAVSQQAIQGILSNFDSLEGGFGQAPKFPHETMLLLLLDEQKRQASQDKLIAINTSLQAMAQGGLYDVIGGGFARYSTDNAWLVPHFEKMLYNQAQLALVYTKAYQLTHLPLYERITRQTLDYVIKEMHTKQGGFYSATDADSEGEEGTFFVWDLIQIEQTLGKELFAQAQNIFDFSPHTLFEDKHIIRYQEPTNLDHYPLADKIIAQLYPIRQKRPKPLLDNKILLSWNAMMARTFLSAGQTLGEEKYQKVAQQSFDFLQKFYQNKQLKRVLLEEQYSTDALLEDYANFIALSLDMYDEFAQTNYLNFARQLMDEAITKFWDKDNFAFFNHRSKNLYIQTKTAEDGAIASGNAIIFEQLVRLSRLDNNNDYQQYAQQLLSVFSSKITQYSPYYATMITGLNLLLKGNIENIQWLYQGKVLAKLSKNKDNYQVHIILPKGYHINSQNPKQKELIPTSINNLSPDHWQLHDITYPNPSYQTLSFSQDSLAVYSGNVIISFKAKPISDAYQGLKISLTLQACNDKVCLPPQTITLFY